MFALLPCVCIWAASLLGAGALRLKQHHASASANTAKPWFERSDSEKWVAMVQLAGGTYSMRDKLEEAEWNETGNATGWHTIHVTARESTTPDSPTKDSAVLYRRNEEPVCALGFAGSYEKDREDWLHNADIRVKAWCGRARVHSGFANYMEKLRREPGFRELVGKMGNRSLCGNGIIALGHSSGGAQASLFASCANAWLKKDLQWQWLLSGVRVKELYTFGAPEVALGGLKNDQSRDGCFSGYRFYREDDWLRYDPVPMGFRLLHSLMIPSGEFRHPAIKAVKLSQDDTNITHTDIHSCWSSPKFPSWGPLRGFKSLKELAPNIPLHSIREYADRIRDVV